MNFVFKLILIVFMCLHVRSDEAVVQKCYMCDETGSDNDRIPCNNKKKEPCYSGDVGCISIRDNNTGEIERKGCYNLTMGWYDDCQKYRKLEKELCVTCNDTDLCNEDLKRLEPRGIKKCHFCDVQPKTLPYQRVRCDNPIVDKCKWNSLGCIAIRDAESGKMERKGCYAETDDLHEHCKNSQKVAKELCVTCDNKERCNDQDSKPLKSLGIEQCHFCDVDPKTESDKRVSCDKPTVRDCEWNTLGCIAIRERETGKMKRKGCYKAKDEWTDDCKQSLNVSKELCVKCNTDRCNDQDAKPLKALGVSQCYICTSADCKNFTKAVCPFAYLHLVCLATTVKHEGKTIHMKNCMEKEAAKTTCEVAKKLDLFCNICDTDNCNGENKTTGGKNKSTRIQIPYLLCLVLFGLLITKM